MLQDKHLSDSISDGEKPKTRSSGDLNETFGQQFEALLDGTGISGSKEIYAALRASSPSVQV